MIPDVAVGILTAVTRVCTDCVDARLTGCTVRVGLTFRQIGRRWYAVVVSVLGVTGWTIANGIVVLHVANGTTSAYVSSARIFALFVVTRTVQRTVVIDGTFLVAWYSCFRCTFDVWVADVLRWTRAATLVRT